MARPPPTPKRPLPWDPPPLPAQGAARVSSIFLAVGKALSAWESFEDVLASIFGTLVAPTGNQLAARRSYGSVLTFRGRADMIETGVDAVFWDKQTAPIHKEIRNLTRTARGFAGRRNEIAHGIAGVYQIKHPAFDDRMAGYVLGPPAYATNKTVLMPGRIALEYVHHAPKYAYCHTQIDAFRRHFVQLEKTARLVWLELLRYRRAPASS